MRTEIPEAIAALVDATEKPSPHHGPAIDWIRRTRGKLRRGTMSADLFAEMARGYLAALGYVEVEVEIEPRPVAEPEAWTARARAWFGRLTESRRRG